MVYVGNEPTSNFASVTKDLFSGDGSTVAFTLSKASTTNGVAVFVENVRQEPTIAYAVSGTTLTFTAAPVTSSGNNIYVLHHNAVASTANHPAAQDLTAVKGTFTGDVSIDGGSFVFNESSADKDFRVESDNRTHALFVNGADGNIGINATPESWHSNFTGIDIGDQGFIGHYDGGSTYITTNRYYDASAVTWKAKETGTGGTYSSSADGSHWWTMSASVSADANATNTTIATMNPSRFLKVYGSYGVHTSSGAWHELNTAEAGSDALIQICSHASRTAIGNVVYHVVADSNTNAKFYAGYSGYTGSPDLEFYARNDGQIYADGSFNGSGADYAEFFEWKDGNSSSEDRLGYSVVLDGNQIRKATSDDSASNIIGVISGNPSVIGDADGETWNSKYLKDDYGVYIREDSEIYQWVERVEDSDQQKTYYKGYVPDGVTVPDDATTTKTTVRKLNPDYDKSKTYERREDRKEWSYVGMMGKLRMRKGQPTGDRWIKMRDISDTVEEWIVR